MNKKLICQPYRDYNYYICSTYKKMNTGVCTKHSTRSDKLEQIVLAVIQKQIELAVEMDELLDSISESNRSCWSSIPTTRTDFSHKSSI